MPQAEEGAVNRTTLSSYSLCISLSNMFSENSVIGQARRGLFCFFFKYQNSAERALFWDLRTLLQSVSIKKLVGEVNTKDPW